jgi:hypothetical protein
MPKAMPPLLSEETTQILAELESARANFRQTFALLDIFAVIYEPITRLTVLSVEQKTARVPEVTLGIVKLFYGYYRENRTLFLQNKPVETHWQPYYHFIKGHKNVRSLQPTEVRDLLFLGIEGHILGDFPRVLGVLIAQHGREPVRIAFDEATPIFKIARDQSFHALAEAARRNRVNMPTPWVMKQHACLLDTLGAAQSVPSLLRMREKAWQMAISWEKLQSRDKI